ncbi:hypothetical protein GGI04_004540 [Coemansia thaxteri]|nr:hypothetical protein GGI04_004540 [Coemansia thaxteri]
MGGHGTWTPFHEDVFRSYSWSANICGEKRWILVPPGQTHLFTDRLGNWVHNILDYDQRAFPRLGELKKFEVVQKPGEALFVPSGWWHQVLNVGHTISINHNWSNEFNLQRMYERLAQDLGNVKHALRDVTDMDGFDDHAQLVLRADSGIDYRGFFAFVRHMATRYMKLCAGSPPPAGNWTVDHVDSYFTSPASVRRALEKIDSVLTLLASDPDTPKISGGLATEISCLRSEIKEALLVTH